MSDGNGTTPAGGRDTRSGAHGDGLVVRWQPESWQEEPPAYNWSRRAKPQFVEARPQTPIQTAYVPDWPAIRTARFELGDVAYTSQRADASHPLSVYANSRWRSAMGNVMVTLRVTVALFLAGVVVSIAVVIITAFVRVLEAM